MKQPSNASVQPWWRAQQDVLNPSYLHYIMDEDAAVTMWLYEARLVPGLLQTEAYARAAIDLKWPDWMAPQYVKQLLTVRMERQWRIFDRPVPPAIHCILDQAVLHRPFGGPEVLYAQLAHLRKLTALPFVTLQIMPLEAADKWPIHCAGGFALFQLQGDAQSLVLHQGTIRLTTERITDPFRTMQYKEKIFKNAELLAADPEESLALIAQAMAAIDTRGDGKR